MVIYRCDRCEKLMNSPHHKIKQEKGYNASLDCDEVEFFDLCENCSLSFNLFIQGGAIKPLKQDSFEKDMQSIEISKLAYNDHLAKKEN